MRGEILKAIQIAAGTYNRDIIELQLATVNSVDTVNWLCNVTTGGDKEPVTLDNVQLTAEMGSDGMIAVPAIESTVILAITKNKQIYVFKCSDIQEWAVYVSNGNGGYTSYILQSTLQQFNDGSYGGLLIGKNVANKLNNLENLLNNLILQYNSHTHIYIPGTGSPIPTTAALPTEAGSINPITQESDLENPLITHGK